MPKKVGKHGGNRSSEIITASYIAGLYFQENYPDANIFLIGESAMEQELDGFDVARTKDPMEATHLLVGMDSGFTYEKLHIGMKSVRNGSPIDRNQY
ncbi:hypothetical protein [Ferviditalea candida]|uniref:Uncharacterized protein n=1 Tax=Ferviditalea candida TaxID=3108399 RepID=A0ABU5ZN70_9BACL|nr:hypothetical protein [Paenibacillaceae bacterium T2]